MSGSVEGPIHEALSGLKDGRFSLRDKILFGFFAVLALLVVVWAWSIFALWQLGNASEQILEENFRSILAAESMIDVLERQNSAALLVMLGEEEAGTEQFRGAEIEFLQWLGRAKDNITVEGEEETLLALEQEYATFLGGAADLRAASMAGDSAAADAIYEQRVLPSYASARAHAIRLRELNQAAMLSASARARQIARQAIGSTVAGGAVGALAGLGLSLWLSSFLVRPLQEMTAATGRIAEGDYDVALAVKSRDELGRLAEEIMTLSRKLKEFHQLNVTQLMTERRRSEAVIRSIADGLLVVDQECLVVALNPVAAEIFGVDPDAARGKHFFDVVENPALYERVRASAESGRASSLDDEQAILAVQHNDETAYYRYAIAPVKTEGGSLLGVVLLLQDVTKLKELDRLKSDFVMTASHELRTPLTSMSMSLDLLLESAADKLSDEERHLVQTAEEDVARLRALVNDLLDLSKIESGNMPMEFDRAETDRLIGHVLSLFEEQVHEREVELVSRLDEPLPDIRADANKIAWVLTNLIGNALRYSPPGGQIEVSARAIGRFVHFAVTDEGPGVPLEYQSKIFDKFVQVRDDQAPGGTGLGLAICREIVKAHGGTIWLDSVEGAGSRFTFTTPVVGEAPEQEKRQEDDNAEVAHSDRG